MNWKNLWPRARTGLLIGMLVQLCLLWSMQDTYGSALEITVWMAASMIYGVSSALFDWERLSVLGATGLHFVLSYAVTVTVCWLLGYGQTLGESALLCLPLFLILYVLIYLGITLTIHVQMKKVNEKLQK